jgi:hypothetical protein
MAPKDRLRGRNIHIYDANNLSIAIGGLILTDGVTNANFYSMVEVLVLFTSNFELCNESNTRILRNNDPLQPGDYFIHSSG